MSTSSSDGCTLCAAGIRRTGDAIDFMEETPSYSSIFELLPRAPSRSLDEWQNFRPPDQIPVNHPWLSRHSPSALLFLDGATPRSNLVNTTLDQSFGDKDHPLAFDVGNGRPAHSGVIGALCDAFIKLHGSGFRIGLVQNHARQNLVALLSEVVPIAFTDDDHNLKLAVAEGWCDASRQVFHEHGLLVGPKQDPAGLSNVHSFAEALRTLVPPDTPSDGLKKRKQMLFHSCGDGSATFFRKLQHWLSAGIDVSHVEWTKSWARGTALDPFTALARADQEGAYVMAERSTYLTAKDQGVVPNLRVYIEGDASLLAPCTMAMNRRAATHDAAGHARKFADWVCGDQAQEIIAAFGQKFSYAKSLVTVAAQPDFEPDQLLRGRL